MLNTHTQTSVMFSLTLSLSFVFSVNLMKSKLDPEGLGVILLGQFLLEFFPDQVQ